MAEVSGGIGEREGMSVAAGDCHSLALTAEGTLFSFGSGYYGQLGHGDTANQPRPKRVVALAKERVVSVAGGDNHSLVLTAESVLFSFGRGGHGQLGHGDTANQLRPKRVVLASTGVLPSSFGLFGLFNWAIAIWRAIWGATEAD